MKVFIKARCLTGTMVDVSESALEALLHVRQYLALFDELLVTDPVRRERLVKVADVLRRTSGYRALCDIRPASPTINVYVTRFENELSIRMRPDYRICRSL